ncbi:hypothetical protein [Mycobacteroides abscessus]
MSEREFEDHGDGLLARLIWSNNMPLPEHLADRNIQAVVAQRPDGTVVTHDPSLSPRVYIYDSALTITDARALAKALTDAANLADRWCGSLDIRKLSDRELLEILPELELVEGRGEALRETVKNVINLGDVARQWVYQEMVAATVESEQ